MRSPRLVALVVVLAGALLAHGRSLGHGFVYDDHRFIERNAALEHLGDVGRFFTDPTTASAAQGVEPDVWRPLRTLAFAVDRALFGLDPRGWHASSLLLHLVNAALVWLLLRRIFARDPDGRRRSEAAASTAAAAGALLFAVHPVTVECVAWVSSRGDLLAWTLALLALEVAARPGRRATVAVVVLGALACLAKESAVVLFALLPLHRAALPADARPSGRETAVRTAALFAATIGYFAWRAAVLPTAPDLPAFAQLGFPDGSRLAAVRAFLASVTWYARLLLLPAGFPFDRNAVTDPVPGFSDPAVVVGAGIVLTAGLAGLLALRRRASVVPLATWGTLAVLVPVAGILVPLKAFAAQRFLYPALPGLAAGAVAAGLALAQRVADARRASATAPAVVVGGVAAVVLVVLGGAADARGRPWHDEAALWEAVQRDDPMNPRAYDGLGFEHLRAGYIDRAERAFATYREFQPFDGKVRAERAAVLRQLYRDLSTAVVPGSSGATIEDVQIPRFVLVNAIEESRAAITAWDREAGLVRGRGDAALRRATLEGWREAALDYGDLLEAARVNDLLAADDGAPRRPAAYEQRRMPPILAGLALQLPSGPDPASRGGDPRAQAQRDLARRRTRAELLTRVGVDPALGDADAWAALLPALDALLAERPRDDAIRRHRVTGHLVRVEALAGAAQADALATLEADLVALVDRHPRERGLVDLLARVRARRAGR